MATTTEIARPDQPRHHQPLLEPGDHLTREEFERRYELMSNLKKAELVEGTVYMPSPVRMTDHAEPHLRLATWLGTYAAERPGVLCGDNSTVRLDFDNEPQPDLLLMKTEGGQAIISSDGFVEGAPELIAEVAGSSRAYDLHQKKDAYRRNGVREYLVWVTEEDRLCWHLLTAGHYVELPPDQTGVLKSTVFPGLWLDREALLKSDMKKVLAVLKLGLQQVPQ